MSRRDNFYPAGLMLTREVGRMICPLRNHHINPSRCLLCPHFGGFRNQGVLCFKVNRWLHYEIARRM